MATRYVALLRGINVGGNRKVPMADLRQVVESLGHHDVGTYIQSGNVVLTAAGGASSVELEDALEAAIEQRFGFPMVVVVRSARQLRAVVAKAPEGFGGEPDSYHCDVVFLKAPLTAARAIALVDPREGVDESWKGAGVMYFRRLSARRTQSRFGKIASFPEYQLMTIRSWATTTKLVTLLDP